CERSAASRYGDATPAVHVGTGRSRRHTSHEQNSRKPRLRAAPIEFTHHASPGATTVVPRPHASCHAATPASWSKTDGSAVRRGGHSSRYQWASSNRSG